MKRAKKVIALVLCAILLMAISVMGTLAYLTSRASVTNTFTVGKVGITMDEAKVTEYGVPVDGADRVITNAYKLVPGQTYTKDPTIHVAADSEPCYLFVKIEAGANFTLNGMTGWTNLDGNIWYYNTVATAGQDVPVFGSFTYTSDINASETPAEENIAVTAYAIQSENTGDAAEAWTKLSAQLNLK